MGFLITVGVSDRSRASGLTTVPSFVPSLFVADGNRRRSLFIHRSECLFTSSNASDNNFAYHTRELNLQNNVQKRDTGSSSRDRYVARGLINREMRQTQIHERRSVGVIDQGRTRSRNTSVNRLRFKIGTLRRSIFVNRWCAAKSNDGSCRLSAILRSRTRDLSWKFSSRFISSLVSSRRCTRYWRQRAPIFMKGMRNTCLLIIFIIKDYDKIYYIFYNKRFYLCVYVFNLKVIIIF